MEESVMARITVEIEDSKAALLREKAEKFGLLADQFVIAYIEDIIAQPEPDFRLRSSNASSIVQEQGTL